METLCKVVGAILVVCVIVFIVAAIFALPMMLLVNYIFSDAALLAVFGGPIGFWKAFWLNFLAGMLFKTSVTTKSD